MTTYHILVIIVVLLCSLSQLLLKKSALSKHRHTIYEFVNWKVILAYSILFISIVLNIFALKNGVLLKELIILETLSYIFVPVFSIIILKEIIEPRTILAMFIILAGIIIFYL